MQNDEKGITLIEMLAALALISIVGLLIWTTFLIATKHNISATKNLNLQQEVNYILTELQRQHRQSDCYELEIGDSVSIRNCVGDREFVNVLSTGLKYEPTEREIIKPRETDLILDFIISDPNNNKNKVKVETAIARYKAD